MKQPMPVGHLCFNAGEIPAPLRFGMAFQHCRQDIVAAPGGINPYRFQHRRFADAVLAGQQRYPA